VIVVSTSFADSPPIELFRDKSFGQGFSFNLPDHDEAYQQLVDHDHSLRCWTSHEMHVRSVDCVLNA
jgi:hypothetical protein